MQPLGIVSRLGTLLERGDEVLASSCGSLVHANAGKIQLKNRYLCVRGIGANSGLAGAWPGGVALHECEQLMMHAGQHGPPCSKGCICLDA